MCFILGLLVNLYSEIAR